MLSKAGASAHARPRAGKAAPPTVSLHAAVYCFPGLGLCIRIVWEPSCSGYVLEFFWPVTRGFGVWWFRLRLHKAVGAGGFRTWLWSHRHPRSAAVLFFAAPAGFKPLIPSDSCSTVETELPTFSVWFGDLV